MRTGRALVAAAAAAVALACACSSPAPAPPTEPTKVGPPAVVAQTPLSERMLDLTVRSPALGRTAWACRPGQRLDPRFYREVDGVHRAGVVRTW
jgi:hypothetical protein